MSPKKAPALFLLGILAFSSVSLYFFSRTIYTDTATANLAAVTSAFLVEGSEGEEARDAKIFSSLLLKGQEVTVSSPYATATVDARQLQVAKIRAQAMKELAKKDAWAFLENAFSTTERAKLPEVVQAEVETQTIVKGIIEVLHIDDFNDEKNSRFKYRVRSADKSLELYFAGNAPAMMSGSLVQVNGFQLGDTVVSAGDSGDITILNATQPDAVGTQKTLVILITSPELPITPTKEEMRTTIFSGNFKRFYEEQSYGKVRFIGDVTDWISIPFIPGCDSPRFDQPQVKNYIIEHGIDLSRYGRVMFVNNGWSGGCAYVGKLNWYFNGGTYHLSVGWTGWPNSGWQSLNMSGFEHVLSHEMGHELGVMHANAWSCRGSSLDTNCSHTEYGNLYDMMGYGVYSKHFNAFYKDILGWLSPADKVTITHTGQYQLAPIEAQSGVRAGIIRNPALPDATTQPIYLEFRQPIGFDSMLPSLGAGIHINKVISPSINAVPMTRFINTNYLRVLQALLPGERFTWDKQYFSIGSLTMIPSAATFDVTLTTSPVCHIDTIDIVELYKDTSVSYGYDFGRVRYSLKNNDSVVCDSSSIFFTTSISGSAGWTINTDKYSPLLLSPGETTYVEIHFSPPEGLSGSAVLTSTFQDTTHSRTYQRQETITIIASPTITSISPTFGIAGYSSVTLSGAGFDPLHNYMVITGASVTNIIYVGDTTQLDRISFIFPEFLRHNLMRHYVPTPPGIYSIRAVRGSDGGLSNEIFFEVIPAPPEITVLGNGMTIAYGDTVPSTADHTNFGVVTQGSTAVVRTFTVKNTGTGALTTSTLILPTGFSLVEGLSASIAPGASDTFQVKMDTIARGEKTGNISFTNNDSDENPFYFTIIGRVIGPEIVVLGNGVIIIDGDTTPSTADQTNFGTVVKNSAPPVRTFTIKNDGTSTLNLVVPQHPLGFSIIDYLEPSLAPGASDLLKVKMDTSLTGTNTGQISFTNNDSDENPFNFTITGTVTL